MKEQANRQIGQGNNDEEMKEKVHVFPLRKVNITDL